MKLPSLTAKIRMMQSPGKIFDMVHLDVEKEKLLQR